MADAEPGQVEWRNAVREAYEHPEEQWRQQWLKAQALEYPRELLTEADAIGVSMPWGSRLWLEKHAEERERTAVRTRTRIDVIDLADRESRTVAPREPCSIPNCYGFQPQVIGGPHWHVIVDGKDTGANPWAPEPRPAQTSRVQTLAPPPEAPREHCRDCGDLLPRHRLIPWCVRCNKVRLQAAQKAKPKVERPAAVYHCLACRTNIPDPGLGPRLCARCAEERYVEQPTEDDGVLVRNTGAMPHLAFYMNRCGESVVNGRILPHPRYGESRMDRFGDSPELDDS